MSLDFPFAVSAIKLFAVIARVGAFIFAFPSFSSQSIPKTYKVLFIITLSICLLPVLPDKWGDAGFVRNMDMMKLFFILFFEVLLGLTIALFVMVIMEIFSFGGFIIDRSMGFVMARSIDPTTGANRTVFSGLLVQIFILVFLIADGHHEIIRLAAASFHTIGPGEFILNAGMVEEITTLSAKIFFVGLQIGLPVFTVMLFVNIGMGLMARVGQDFPVLMLSFPIRIGLGILIMTSIFPILLSVCRQMTGEIVDSLAWILQIEM